MLIRRLIQSVLGCFAVSALALAAPRAATQPVMLLSSVEIGTKTVLLSDLLPETALAPLREAVATISLGSAPMPGRSRVVTRAEIQETLAGNPELEASLSIPTQITVRRACQLVSREQVSAALVSTLGTDSAKDLVDFSMLTPVCFSGDDPGLEVADVEFDPLQRVTRFRLWTSKEPRNLPFYVTLPARSDDAARKFRSAGRSGVSATAASSNLKNQPLATTGVATLVKAGAPTRLVIEGPDCRITTVVVPLQSGALGQQVRARDPLTLKVFSAHVAGPALLTANL